MSENPVVEALRVDVLLAAKLLLGTHLVAGGMRAAIVETEAYRADDDPAAHGFRGKTKRTEVMFGEPGFAYVYFSYGVHWMLNVTAHGKDRAAGVLIRAAMPIDGIDAMRANRESADRKVPDKNLLAGPGKLAQAFGIDGEDNGIALFDPNSPLHLELGESPREFVATRRVGIAIGKAHENEWRFIDRERVAWASSPRPKIDL